MLKYYTCIKTKEIEIIRIVKEFNILKNPLINKIQTFELEQFKVVGVWLVLVVGSWGTDKVNDEDLLKQILN